MPRKIASPTLQDKLDVASTRLPTKVLAIIDNMGRKQMRTRADMMRALLIEHLQNSGLVARYEEKEETK